MLPMYERDIDSYLFGMHFRFGDNVSNSLGNELSVLGLNRPIVLTQTRMAESKQYKAIVTPLRNGPIFELLDIPQHGSVEWIETVRSDLQGFSPDCIVAIGGGSVSDSAKALAMLLAEQGQLIDHATVFTPPDSINVPVRNRPKLPIIAIPTTASGAEVTPSFGVRDGGHHKHLFWNRELASTSILLDPLLSADIPLAVLRCTAMNGIAHCLEGMYSSARSVVSDALAIQALGIFTQAFDARNALGKGMSESAQRRAFLLAGHLSGMVLSLARSCLHHAVCHVIGARHGLPHGVVNTVMLPHTIRFNEPEVSQLLAPALNQINRQSFHRFDSTPAWLLAIREQFALPSRLSDLGVTEQDFEAIAQQTLKERGLAFNPRAVTGQDQIVAMLRQAL